VRMIFSGLPLSELGRVTAEPRLRVRGGRGVRIDLTLDDLRAAWRAPLAW